MYVFSKTKKITCLTSSVDICRLAKSEAKVKKAKKGPKTKMLFFYFFAALRNIIQIQILYYTETIKYGTWVTSIKKWANTNTFDITREHFVINLHSFIGIINRFTYIHIRTFFLHLLKRLYVNSRSFFAWFIHLPVSTGNLWLHGFRPVQVPSFYCA